MTTSAFPFLSTDCGGNLTYNYDIPARIVRVDGTKAKGPPFDIFIGYKGSSMWKNFFAKCKKYSPQKRNEMYSRSLDNNPFLKSKLHQLAGLRLACDCHDIENCHGKVLLERLQNLANKVKYTLIGGKYCVFNGALSPLSNMAFGKIVSEDGVEFKSAYHMYGWKLARDMRELFVQRALEREKDPKKIHDFIQNLYKQNYFPWTKAESICELFKILQLKWVQDVGFRRECMKYRGILPLMQGANCFWCSGISCEQLKRFLEYECDTEQLRTEGEILHCDKSNIKIGGRNIMGWVIVFLIKHQTGDKFEKKFFNRMPVQLKLGYEKVRTSLADGGINVTSAKPYKPSLKKIL